MTAQSQTPLGESSWGFDSPRPYHLESPASAGLSLWVGDRPDPGYIRSGPLEPA